jgi:hypothetical protein
MVRKSAPQGEPPQPRLSGSDLPPTDETPPRPDLESVDPPGRSADEQRMRKPVRPSTSKGTARRRMDRYDIIGLVIVGLLAALLVAHFLLPTPPPDNVPDPNPTLGKAPAPANGSR